MKTKYIIPLLAFLGLVSCHKHDSIAIQQSDSVYYFNQSYTFHADTDDTEHLYWFLNDEYVSKGKSCTIKLKEHGIQTIKAVHDARKKKPLINEITVDVESLVHSFGKHGVGDGSQLPINQYSSLNVVELEYSVKNGGDIAAAYDRGLLNLSTGNANSIEVYFFTDEPKKGYVEHVVKDGKTYYSSGTVTREGDRLEVIAHGEYYNSTTGETETIDLHERFVISY